MNYSHNLFFFHNSIILICLYTLQENKLFSNYIYIISELQILLDLSKLFVKFEFVTMQITDLFLILH